MKLLIITQKVDKQDPILGFFHRWIEEFAKNFEAVTVICLYEGAHTLPSNVRVFSLGKEKGISKAGFITSFYKLIMRERKNYDAVFVHMNPIYVVLGSPLWRMWGKKVSLWYTHKQVDLKLRAAAMGTHTVFTAARQSFELASRKVVVTGHGIDVGKFGSVPRTKNLGEEPLRIVSVGRLTPIKDPITLIEAVKILKRSWKKRFEVVFIGAAVTEHDKEYEREVRALIATNGLDHDVTFMGDVSPDVMPRELARSDISVNLTPTGGVDKVVLEAMAAGVPVLSSNLAFKDYFGPLSKELIFERTNAADLARKIMNIFDSGQASSIGQELQKVARERADVGRLVRTLVKMMQRI